MSQFYQFRLGRKSYIHLLFYINWTTGLWVGIMLYNLGVYSNAIFCIILMEWTILIPNVAYDKGSSIFVVRV